jgi:chemotaxis protein methyltransferase CheR
MEKVESAIHHVDGRTRTGDLRPARNIKANIKGLSPNMKGLSPNMKGLSPNMKGLSPKVDCVGFLQWALPRLGRRWAGYRKVRRQVCRRVRRRIEELGLDGFGAYRERLEAEPDEWAALDGLMNVTISRFNRDRGVFEYLRHAVLEPGMRVWSAGCASGEEPYTLALLCDGLDILATDVDRAMLRRAEAARYPASALRELADGDAFTDGVLAERYRHVTFARHDVRDDPPAGPFDLVLCRNLAFTYFDEPTQRATLQRFASVTPTLVIGAHESLPEGQREFSPRARCVFQTLA